MAKGWYVLQAFTGHENKVEKYLRILLEDNSLSEIVFDIKVPSEEITKLSNGKKRTVNRKFLPGYILVEMDLPDRGWKSACNAIRRIPGVTGFVGTGQGSKPQPITSDEAKAILQKSGAIKPERRTALKQDFDTGEEIRIIDGPFETFKGTIEVVNQEKGRLRVMVGIFGRNTPVDLPFSHVEKI